MSATIEQLREIIGGDAESLAELEAITAANNGELTPDAVLEAARDEASPLHKHFEWNDTDAAIAWRKHQARALIRSYQLHIVDATGDRTIRYYTNVVVQDEHVYKRTEEVLSVAALREQRRMKIIRELNRVRGEMVTFDEFAQAVANVDGAIDALRSSEVQRAS